MDNILVGASHVAPINEKQLVPSMPAQPLVTQEQTNHVIENSSSPNQGSKTMRTWKKLARENPMETDTP